MIPLTLVTGFLGSGKTTLLRRIFERNRERNYVYLVNEFAAADIDGQMVGCDLDSLVAVPGGSIFCKCLVTEFVGHLSRLAERHAAGPQIEGVVIEASGIANPKVVGRMLQETGLDQAYDLGTIVNIVDPGSFMKLIHTLPNILAQVEAGDLAILNKIDLYEENELSAAEDELRRINPSLHITRASHCQIDCDLFGSSSSRALTGEYATCVDPNFATATAVLPMDIDLDRLLDDIGALGDDVYRVKGFVRVNGACHYLDISPGGVSLAPAAPPEARTELIFIVRGDARKRLEPVVRRISAY